MTTDPDVRLYPRSYLSEFAKDNSRGKQSRWIPVSSLYGRSLSVGSQNVAVENAASKRKRFSQSTCLSIHQPTEAIQSTETIDNCPKLCPIIHTMIDDCSAGTMTSTAPVPTRTTMYNDNTTEAVATPTVNAAPTLSRKTGINKKTGTFTQITGMLIRPPSGGTGNLTDIADTLVSDPAAVEKKSTDDSESKMRSPTMLSKKSRGQIESVSSISSMETPESERHKTVTDPNLPRSLSVDQPEAALVETSVSVVMLPKNRVSSDVSSDDRTDSTSPKLNFNQQSINGPTTSSDDDKGRSRSHAALDDDPESESVELEDLRANANNMMWQPRCKQRQSLARPQVVARSKTRPRNHVMTGHQTPQFRSVDTQCDLLSPRGDSLFDTERLPIVARMSVNRSIAHQMSNNAARLCGLKLTDDLPWSERITPTRPDERRQDDVTGRHTHAPKSNTAKPPHGRILPRR